MDSFFSTLKLGVNTAVYSARFFSRLAFSSLSGVCPTCNNLQPTGHENTLHRSRGMLDVGVHPRMLAARAEASSVPSLCLENIPLNNILKVRRLEENGRMESICRYCDFIVNVLEVMFPHWKPDWAQGFDTTPRRLVLMIREGTPLVIRCENFAYEHLVAHPRIDIEVYYGLGHSLPSGLGIPTLGPALPRSMESDSPECMNFVRESYRDCLDNHGACRLYSAGNIFSPTRLLYIADDKIRLCESGAEDSATTSPSWAALSHCWGTSTFLTLRQASLDQMKLSIDPSSLPETFRNAVRVARTIGIDYIWIDALCIIQDSERDWQKEASTMRDVFRNAVLVITAAASPNPDTPFLAPRAKDWKPHNISFQSTADSAIQMLCRRRHLLATDVQQGLKDPPYTKSWAATRSIGQLYRRAWTFQEVLLGTRVLHYTPGGLVFECKTHKRVEGQLPPYIETTENCLGTIPDDEIWREIVHAYTTRELTFVKDRLPALSGIALDMLQQRKSNSSQAKEEQYLAGLWESSFAIDILWHTVAGWDTELRALTYTQYIAPTWSWASVNHGVAWNDLSSPQILVKAEGFSVPRKGFNPFGEINMSFALVRGRLVRCRVRLDVGTRDYYASLPQSPQSPSSGRKKGNKEYYFPSDGLLINDTSAANETRLRRAFAEEITSYAVLDAEAWFLCVAKTSWMNYGHMGLVLGFVTMLQGFRTFQRLGCLSHVTGAWYDDGEEELVCLV